MRAPFWRFRFRYLRASRILSLVAGMDRVLLGIGNSDGIPWSTRCLSGGPMMFSWVARVSRVMENFPTLLFSSGSFAFSPGNKSVAGVGVSTFRFLPGATDSCPT